MDYIRIICMQHFYVPNWEELVLTKLLPAYIEYCTYLGKEVDIKIPAKRIPALLDKNFGVSVATSNARKPRKN